MEDVLYKYCVCYTGQEVFDHNGENRSKPKATSDKSILSSCDRVFLIDGQSIDLKSQIEKLYGKAPADATLFSRDSAGLADRGANDSIHFQQIRAVELADSLLAAFDAFHTPSDKGEIPPKLKVAIVGAGFAGVTCALRILNRSTNSSVVVYEHHRQAFPRIYQAFGRMVSPYHHLRHPGDKILESSKWECPINQGGIPEKGGIQELLEWYPGEVQAIGNQVAQQWSDALEKFKGRLDFVKQTAVVAMETGGDVNQANPYNIRIADNPSGEKQTTSNKARQFRDTGFFAVVVAPGGGRKADYFYGQAQWEYWRPQLVENLPPRVTPYKVAIIGGGNTAASEIFSCLFKKRDFIGFLDFVNKAITAAGLPDTTLRDVMANLSADNSVLASIATKLEDQLTRDSDEFYGKSFIQIALITRKPKDGSTDDYGLSKMNDVNRFITLLLIKAGRIRLIRVERVQSRYAHSLDDTHDGCRLTSNGRAFPAESRAIFFNGKRLGPDHGFDRYGLSETGRFNFSNDRWDWIVNCLEPERKYFKMFSQDNWPGMMSDEAGRAQPSSIPLAQVLENKARTINLVMQGN